jgi:hypothetical protein
MGTLKSYYTTDEILLVGEGDLNFALEGLAFAHQQCGEGFRHRNDIGYVRRTLKLYGDDAEKTPKRFVRLVRRSFLKSMRPP